MSRFERAAVELAENGYYVFPCRERDKNPLTKNGYKDATRDERTILHWWDKTPDANIGVACGASGIVAFDIDAKNGADPDDVLGALAEHGHAIDGAAITRTGEAPEPDGVKPTSLAGVRGAHVIWRGRMTTTNRLKITGTEIRGIGSYIVVAPSVHPSGVEYTGKLPPVDQLPDIPEWLPRLVQDNGNGSAAPVPDVIGENRNTALTSLAGTMRRRGMSEQAILAALQTENRAKCRPPLADAEVAKIAKSVAKYPPAAGHREPSDLSDLVVPDWLQSELEAAGVNDEDIEGAGSLADLMKLLGGAKDNVATQIVKALIEAGVTFFHDDTDVSYASFTIDGHTETWPVQARAFRLYARRLYYEKTQAAPSGQSLTDALGVVESKALFEGPAMEVHYRVAGDERAIYIDLGDPGWRAIEITRGGWRVLDHHPVRFRRTGAMAALPVPVAGGSLDTLRGFVNVADDHAWRLVVGWLLAALRPGYPYPVLVAHGEQGSAKSTLGRVLRALVDPNQSPLRVAPHDVDDLMVSAASSWVVAYDNVSRIPPALSDALCRLSTGGGLSKRMLYTDADEVLLDAKRPVILNGISESANRSDLLDRSLLIEMPLIPEDKRISEDKFWALFNSGHAQILGGLCDALAGALDSVDSVNLDRLPRMADLALWVTAAEPALGWEPGAFLESYAGNRATSHEIAVESSLIGPALIQVADAGFEGTMSGLLAAVTEVAGEKVSRDKAWPTTARALAAELKRLSPNLRQLGFEVAHDRQAGGSRTRIVSIGRSE